MLSWEIQVKWFRTKYGHKNPDPTIYLSLFYKRSTQRVGWIISVCFHFSLESISIPDTSCRKILDSKAVTVNIVFIYQKRFGHHNSTHIHIHRFEWNFILMEKNKLYNSKESVKIAALSWSTGRRKPSINCLFVSLFVCPSLVRLSVYSKWTGWQLL